ncbi:anoctamin-7-like isoform X4 [Mustela lutreola]|uniref:anoctamin-7-like isoform X4 n=1 Tax=Mustela lutreola TaxID=9666 RepID=UPI0027978724|nr:anoctamin-7-like isoform X4 [Mustela lutreola]
MRASRRASGPVWEGWSAEPGKHGAWLGGRGAESGGRAGNLTLFYWKLLALRLGFIVAFEHVVFVRLLVWLVPDVPAALVTKIKRERCLVVQEPADNREVLPSQGHCPQSPGPGASEAERSFKNPGLS